MPKPPQPRRRGAFKHTNPSSPGLRRDLAAAEAAIARVRAYADRLDQLAGATISVDHRSLYTAIATDLRTALTEPEEPRP